MILELILFTVDCTHVNFETEIRPVVIREWGACIDDVADWILF